MIGERKSGEATDHALEAGMKKKGDRAERLELSVRRGELLATLLLEDSNAVTLRSHVLCTAMKLQRS